MDGLRVAAAAAAAEEGGEVVVHRCMASAAKRCLFSLVCCSRWPTK
jgi:hypothetical protein